ncbi:MAG: amidohydrolase family protein, partial [Gammaproteobacteria bacterium]|nr:amidohydrolase family protein [Gammaproteobacteria bacterium]
MHSRQVRAWRGLTICGYRPGIRLVTGAALGVFALGIAAGAQAEAPRIHAITGARIVTAPGKVIENGTVVLRDGLVEAVGPKVAVPADAEVIAALPGWTVYPAFIDAASSVGLDTEAAAAPGRGARGGAEEKRLGIRHELKAVRPEDGVIDRVDLTHASIATHREMGFAAAHVLPDKGVFRGESAVLILREAPAPEIVARDRAAQVIALETSSFMAREYPSSTFGAVATVRQVFFDAARQGEWSERYAANPAGMPPPGYRSSDAPLIAVLRGDLPPVFVVINGLDPGRFSDLAREFNLSGLIVARGLGDREVDLRAAGMPVLLPLEMPDKPDLKDADSVIETGLLQMQKTLLAPGLPAALDAAGVEVAFVTAGMKSTRRFPENLAAVVKAGLPPEKALAAVTTTPARLLGLSRSMGTIEPGKQANLLVVEGDLFTEKPAIRHLFVQGYHQEIEEEKAIGDPNAVVDPRGTWSINTEVMGRSAES